MKIEKACKLLMIREPFYGLFLSSINKLTTDKIPTLAVGRDGINTILYINEKFWNELTDDQQIAVLKHEMMHICFFHITMSNDFVNKMLFNIAADLEINQLIENLPEDALNIKDFGDRGLEPNKGTKAYYEILSKQQREEDEKQGQSCDGSGEGNDNESDSSCKSIEDIFKSKEGKIGNHNKWKDFENISDAERKLIENQVDHVLRDVANQITKSRGTIPGELKCKIDELFKIKEPIFNWKSFFRRVVGNSVFVYTKKTRRKDSNRFEGNPGLKIKMRQHILVAIDTSASVSNSELLDFFSEIHHISKAGVAITIMEIDSRIQKIYKYKNKPDLGISGRGGTDFVPAVNYYNEHSEFNNLIYFTDGEAPLDNFKTKKRVIWVITSDGAQDTVYPGIQINIPKNK